MNKTFFCIFIIFCLAGCIAQNQVKETVAGYDEAASKIHMGDLKQDVLNILGPTQIDSEDKRREVKFDQLKNTDGDIEIYYFRSQPAANGLTTEDEYTPYIFKDGKLVGIGWGMIDQKNWQGRPELIFNPRGKENTETVY